MASIESVGLKERFGKRCEQGVRYLVLYNGVYQQYMFTCYRHRRP